MQEVTGRETEVDAVSQFVVSSGSGFTIPPEGESEGEPEGEPEGDDYQPEVCEMTCSVYLYLYIFPWRYKS